MLQGKYSSLTPRLIVGTPRPFHKFPCHCDCAQREFTFLECTLVRGEAKTPKEKYKMKSILILAAALTSVGFGQEQNRSEITTPPTQTPPTPAQGGAADRQTGGTADTRAGGRLTQGAANVMTNWKLEDLPQPVQKTIQQQAGTAKIADIDREDRSGKTVWEVEFDREGRNTEIHVSDDGTLLPEEKNRFLGRTSAETGLDKAPAQRDTSIGTPAGTQTGRSALLRLGTQWEDLPPQVQQKAMQFGGKAKVEDIDLEEHKDRLAYEIEFQREGRNLEIYFGEDGSILESNDPSVVPAQGAAPTPEAGRSPTIQRPVQPQPVQPQAVPPAQPQPGRNETQPRP